MFVSFLRRFRPSSVWLLLLLFTGSTLLATGRSNAGVKAQTEWYCKAHQQQVKQVVSYRFTPSSCNKVIRISPSYHLASLCYHQQVIVSLKTASAAVKSFICCSSFHYSCMAGFFDGEDAFSVISA